MATKNFTQFDTATPLTTSDYIVGHNAAETAEIRTRVQDILNLKSDSDAQTLLFNEGNKNLTISSGNTVSLSSLVDSSVDTSVRGLTANWQSTYVTVSSLSASWSVNSYLPLSGGTLTGNLTSTNIFATTLNTSKHQTIYEGKPRLDYVLDGQTLNQGKLGRMTMLSISNGGPNSVLNLTETADNKFLEGDVVGVWGINDYPLTVKYTPFGGSQITVTTFQGGGNYNTGAISLVYRNGAFVQQTFSEQNISGIAAELKIESIQPNDPGEPFTTIGRGSFIHGLTLNAGHPKFTNGSDHFHLIQSGAGGSWQTLNGGYNWTTQRMTQHTLAFRGTESTFDIVAAFGASLTANQITPPYGVFPETSNNYLTLWIKTPLASTGSLTVGNIVYFSVTPFGPSQNSLRNIGFTAASYPAKIILKTAVGSADSNADIPAGESLPASAQTHLRLQPINLSFDNWLGAALLPLGSPTTYRASQASPFNNNIVPLDPNNGGTVERIRNPENILLCPDSQSAALSSRGGYNTVSIKNGCELVLDLSTTPLLSSNLPALYEGLPVLVYTSNLTDLSAVNYNGITPSSAKCQYGLPVYPAGHPQQGEFTGEVANYLQQTHDGYIYRSSPTQVIIRLGQLRGTEESRLQKFATPSVDYFAGRSGTGISSSFTKALPPGGLSAVELNGYQLTSGVASNNNKFGTWRNCNTGTIYTLPPILKNGIEYSSFPPVSSSNLQLIVYAGNKDPVHRPVAGLQLFSYERYPNIQPELKETGAVVSKFALGPSCEGFDRDTASIGFGSTAYHYRSMALGHRVETLSAEEIAIGIDQNVLRVTLSGLSVSTPMLSTNGVDTYLKIKQDNGTMYGLKLEII
jgi:hypothetical protein